MSLKAFHLVFIAAAIGLAFGFGGWCLKGYLSEHHTSDLVYAIGSGLVGVGLVFYARAVLKKLKNVSFL